MEAFGACNRQKAGRIHFGKMTFYSGKTYSMNRYTGKIELLDMEFFAHHGCFEDERLIGNRFIVNLTMEADLTVPAASDNIEDAVNYQAVYGIVKREMAVSSHLLEHVARRILESVKKEFPAVISATVKIDKLNPPIGGQLYASSVTMSL